MTPRQLLHKFANVYDFQKDAARSLHISDAYLSDMLAGKRDVSDKVLKSLGYERVVTVRKLDAPPEPKP